MLKGLEKETGTGIGLLSFIQEKLHGGKAPERGILQFRNKKMKNLEGNGCAWRQQA